MSLNLFSLLCLQMDSGPSEEDTNGSTGSLTDPLTFTYPSVLRRCLWD